MNLDSLWSKRPFPNPAATGKADQEYLPLKLNLIPYRGEFSPRLIDWPGIGAADQFVKMEICGFETCFKLRY
jgi:hypothetical protein